ncbi:MAG TPA: LLM class flavin-dependent oxidoreductase [Acidimicrobiia bacterium]|nr:LLM class flavin-dependent oxidoreductase [Acidimicrobiia bacterium]
MHPFPLSVLDLAPVGRGSTPAQALRNSTHLVREAERLGYRRHWVAEHHNMPGIASSSPPVLLAHLAAVTSTIRVGSGGLMLPNHAPLAVAEQFGMLEALHPGRVDLGIGRAPGTDPVTAQALRRAPGPPTADDFPEQLGELLAYFAGAFPEGHPYAQITAVPARGYQPEIWLLGSSTYSAHAAGVLGMPFSFASHFAPAALADALDTYRASFRPTDQLAAPYVMLGVSVLVAESGERARWLAAPGALAFLRLRTGRPDVYPTPEEAAEYHYTPFEREIVNDRMKSQFIGDPASVRRALEDFVAATGADELIVTTMTHAHDDRVESYRLLAHEFSVRSHA